MNDNLQDMLALLAAKLGIAVDHLWAVMVKGAFVDGIAALGAVLLGLVLLVVAYKGYTLFVDEDSEKANDLRQGVGLALLLLGGVMGAILILVNSYNALLALGAPEYYALQQLLALARPK